MKFKGTRGDDVLNGTPGADVFDMSQGGNDIVRGKGGDYVFNFGAAFNAKDRINGGYGHDVLELDGNYVPHFVKFGADTLLNVEMIRLAAGHSYTLVTNDATVAAGKTLIVDGKQLDHSLHFHGSQETDGNFILYGGTGNDVLAGGAGENTFRLGHGGNDTVNDRGGINFLNFGASLTPDDQIHCNGTLALNGDYSNVLYFGAGDGNNGVYLPRSDYTITLHGAHYYQLYMHYMEAAKHIDSLTIDGSSLPSSGTLIFGGHDARDSTTVIGGAGNDSLGAGWGGASTLVGGGGADLLGDQYTGNVTFQYDSASESTSLGFDTVFGYEAASHDFFKLPGAAAINRG